MSKTLVTALVLALFLAAAVIGVKMAGEEQPPVVPDQEVVQNDETKPEPEKPAENKPETEAEPEAKPEADPEVKPEGEPVPEPESKPEVQPEAKPEPKPEPEPTAPVQPAEPAKPAVSEPALGEWNLILANPDNALPDDFTVETESVQGRFVMDKRVAPIVREMIADAKADGVDLMVCSAYRSIDKQKSLFADQVAQFMNSGMSREEAERTTATIIAVPGTSEHHTGLAADIVTPTHQNLDEAFGETAAGQWLQQHAVEYGFILRYPKDKQDITKIIYESWHYRYVGKEHAKRIKEAGLCLEEYLEQLQ